MKKNIVKNNKKNNTRKLKVHKKYKKNNTRKQNKKIKRKTTKKIKIRQQPKRKVSRKIRIKKRNYHNHKGGRKCPGCPSNPDEATYLVTLSVPKIVEDDTPEINEDGIKEVIKKKITSSIDDILSSLDKTGKTFTREEIENFLGKDEEGKINVNKITIARVGDLNEEIKDDVMTNEDILEFVNDYLREKLEKYITEVPEVLSPEETKKLLEDIKKRIEELKEQLRGLENQKQKLEPSTGQRIKGAFGRLKKKITPKRREPASTLAKRPLPPLPPQDPLPTGHVYEEVPNETPVGAAVQQPLPAPEAAQQEPPPQSIDESFASVPSKQNEEDFYSSVTDSALQSRSATPIPGQQGQNMSGYATPLAPPPAPVEAAEAPAPAPVEAAEAPAPAPAAAPPAIIPTRTRIEEPPRPEDLPPPPPPEYVTPVVAYGETEKDTKKYVPQDYWNIQGDVYDIKIPKIMYDSLEAAAAGRILGISPTSQKSIKECEKENAPAITCGPTPPLYIRDVKPNSLADKYGLKPGDIILKINGNSAVSLTLDYAKPLLQDRPLDLRILRPNPPLTSEQLKKLQEKFEFHTGGPKRELVTHGVFRPLSGAEKNPINVVRTPYRFKPKPPAGKQQAVQQPLPAPPPARSPSASSTASSTASVSELQQALLPQENPLERQIEIQTPKMVSNPPLFQSEDELNNLTPGDKKKIEFLNNIIANPTPLK